MLAGRAGKPRGTVPDALAGRRRRTPRRPDFRAQDPRRERPRETINDTEDPDQRSNTDHERDGHEEPGDREALELIGIRVGDDDGPEVALVPRDARLDGEDRVDVAAAERGGIVGDGDVDQRQVDIGLAHEDAAARPAVGRGAVAADGTVALKANKDTGASHIPNRVIVDLGSFVVVTDKFSGVRLEEHSRTHRRNAITKTRNLVTDNLVVAAHQRVETFAVILIGIYRHGITNHDTRTIGRCTIVTNIIFIRVARA